MCSSAAYRKGEILFAEGQAPRGIFVIHQGRMNLSANPPDGKSLILRMAVPGEVVGLPERFPGNVMRPQPKPSNPFRPISSLE
jgi:CRP/FNR family transcriptional regulator, cyclic AMP receptor protein